MAISTTYLIGTSVATKDIPIASRVVESIIEIENVTLQL